MSSESPVHRQGRNFERDAKIVTSWYGWHWNKNSAMRYWWVLPPDIALENIDGANKEFPDKVAFSLGRQGDHRRYAHRELPDFSVDVDATESLLQHLKDKCNVGMNLWIYPKDDPRYSSSTIPYSCNLTCQDDSGRNAVASGRTMLEAISNAVVELAQPVGRRA